MRASTDLLRLVSSARQKSKFAMGNDLSSSLLRCRGTEPQKHRNTEAQSRTPSWHRQRYGSGSIRLGQSIAVRIRSRCSSRPTNPLPAHGMTVACGTAGGH
ncbi:hypothetical protein PSCLAVI8L_90123 [Pseudoclavibacter sp. 8L]|nr:hypothetical protein PSCLAVI8L_90123 [Pseudoclavibacter sp. 8L]